MQNEQQPIEQPQVAAQVPAEKKAKRLHKPKCPICKKKALYRDMKTCNPCGKKLVNGKKYALDSLLYTQYRDLI